MNTLIAYCSRHGSARKTALLLSQELNHTSIKLIDLLNESSPSRLEDYDCIIVGGSIHYGKIQREVRDFCRIHHHNLLKKKLGLYMCYMLEDKAEEEFNDAFDEDLRNHATALGFFGGEFQLNEMNFVDSFVTQNIFNRHKNEFKMDEEAFNSFTTKMNY